MRPSKSTLICLTLASGCCKPRGPPKALMHLISTVLAAGQAGKLWMRNRSAQPNDNSGDTVVNTYMVQGTPPTVHTSKGSWQRWACDPFGNMAVVQGVQPTVQTSKRSCWPRGSGGHTTQLKVRLKCREYIPRFRPARGHAAGNGISNAVEC